MLCKVLQLIQLKNWLGLIGRFHLDRVSFSHTNERNMYAHTYYTYRNTKKHVFSHRVCIETRHMKYVNI